MTWPQPKPEPQACRMVYLTDKPPADAPEMLADEPDLLTVQDINRLTGVSVQTVRNEINAGRLPGCRIGRRLFVPKCRFVEYAMGGGRVGKQV